MHKDILIPSILPINQNKKLIQDIEETTKDYGLFVSEKQNISAAKNRNYVF